MKSLEERRKLFLKIFRKAEKHYGPSAKRLAAEGWKHDWQVLITTILSAQSRDEVTIPIAENLYKHYPTLKKLANAPLSSIERQLKSMNFYKNKSKHIKASAKMLVENYKGKVPDDIQELIKLPGVGRKTANLILSEIHSKDAICVDTHVHRISNVFGIVQTKTPHQTELELEKVAPKRYWPRINRIFVLWGKEVRGRDPMKFLEKI